MNANDKATGKNAAMLVGAPALDLYLKEINWNLRTMMAQADVLDTALQEITRQHPEYLPAPALADGDMPANTKP